jgi:glutathione S-transferase
LELQHKKGSKFIATDRLSIADISFFAWVNIAGFGKVDLSPYKYVNAWLDNLKADSEIQAADKKLPK